jgi:hypothetical protein
VAAGSGVVPGSGPTLICVGTGDGWVPGGTIETSVARPGITVPEPTGPGVTEVLGVALAAGVVFGVGVRAGVVLVELQRAAMTMIRPSSRANTMAMIS